MRRRSSSSGLTTFVILAVSAAATFFAGRLFLPEAALRDAYEIIVSIVNDGKPAQSAQLSEPPAPVSPADNADMAALFGDAAGIPVIAVPMPGEAIGEGAFRTYLDRSREIGVTIDASARDFGNDGARYVIDYEPEASSGVGRLRYRDVNGLDKAGFYRISGISRSNGGVCRAPDRSLMDRRCRLIYRVGDNLFEARGARSGKVRYRFRLLPATG